MDRDVLRELRDELKSSYPTVDARSLLRILGKHGRGEFPGGFLVGGSVADRSAAGARAILSSANRPGKPAKVPWHPLFSTPFYLAMNPDVARASVSPWLHYQVFGRAEGRSPHPLIDTRYLNAWLGTTARGDVVDEYLGSPLFWPAEPSPYVDSEKFMLSGRWDGTTNPLLQIVTEYPDDPWIHRRLMLVDSASRAPTAARMASIGFLLTRSAGALSEIATWTADERESPTSTNFTVVPGFFLGSDGHRLYSAAADVVSADSTVVSLGTESVSVVTGARSTADELVFVTGHVDHDRLRALVASTNIATLVAPVSYAQEIALRQLRRDLGNTKLTVLEAGKQAQVTASRLRFEESSPAASPPADWQWGGAQPESVAVVLAEAHRRRTTGDPRLRSLLTSGAALCLVGREGVNTWLPVVQSRARVVVDPSLLDVVGAFVPAEKLSILPSSGWS